jgi:hypothetical protein
MESPAEVEEAAAASQVDTKHDSTQTNIVQSTAGFSTVKLDLVSQAVRLLEEVRMIMPGVQALIGFLFIAVFNQRFTELPKPFQTLHIVALLLVALAAMCMLSVAAFHRVAEPHKFTREFVERGGGMVAAGLLLLATSVALDFVVVGRLVYGTTAAGIALGAPVFAAYMFFWFAYPVGHRLRHYGLARRNAEGQPPEPEEAGKARVPVQLESSSSPARRQLSQRRVGRSAGSPHTGNFSLHLPEAPQKGAGEAVSGATLPFGAAGSSRHVAPLSREPPV